MMMTQLKLVSEDPNGKSETIVWLPADKRLKEGSSLRLKGDSKWWNIAEVYVTVERASIHDDWRVGGLGCCQ